MLSVIPHNTTQVTSLKCRFECEKEKVKNSRTSETIESKDESNYFVESAETSDTNFVGGWLLILALSMWSIGINIQRKRKN